MTGTQIKRYNGIAGGGKTYNILQEVQDALSAGVEPSRIAVTTFSKEQASDLRETFLQEFNGDVFVDGDHDDEGITISTSHSLALKRCREAGLVDLQEHRIISMDNYSDTAVFKQFFRDSASSYFQYEYVNKDGDEEYRMELPTGNRILKAYNYVRSRGLDYEEFEAAPVDIPARRTEIVETMHKWDMFKDTWSDPETGHSRLLQHTDYLYETYEHELTLDEYDVLVWDEFQDVNKIQYALYQMWRDKSDLSRIVLAGDSNQQIFGFRGASSRYLEGTPTDDEEVIHTSRRCKPAVLETSREILDGVENVDTSDFRSLKPDGSEYGEDERGTVLTHNITTKEKIADLVTAAVNKYTVENDDWDDDDDTDGVYVLARTHSQLKKVEKVLENRGVPFGGMGSRESRWDDDLMPILGALRAFERRESVPPIVLQYLLKNATETGNREGAVKDANDGMFARHIRGGYGYDKESWLDNKENVKPEKVSWLFGGAEDSKTILRRLTLSDYVTNVLKNALATDPDWLPDTVGQSIEPVIKTGTIHSSKGKEAEAVILLSAYSTKQLERYNNGSEDEERRLYYTAATRARSGLHITRDFCGDEVFPPLDH